MICFLVQLECTEALNTLEETYRCIYNSYSNPNTYGTWLDARWELPYKEDGVLPYLLGAQKRFWHRLGY